MARKTLGKPRFYADILQYLKALGYYDVSNNPELWTLDPTNDTKQTMQEFFTNNPQFELISESKTMTRLLSDAPQSNVSGIYAGLLGHNLSSVSAQITFNDNSQYTQTEIESVANASINGAKALLQYNGYSLWQINSLSVPDVISKIGLVLSDFTGDLNPETGAISYGRWFEPEFAFDLKGTVSNGYDGITTQTTVGGHTLSNIKHLGQPNWGNGLPAWTLQKQDDEDYNVGGAKGRKQWQVGFSFLSDDKLFNKEGNPDKFFTYDEDTNQHTFDTSLASFYKLTLNGKLPFIFCPDNDADEKEFALCRITNQPSFSQVANNLWSTSLVITETW
tara:strand:+ start:2019 stop:3020 length:1002 start_codon:yes stop_codon:yes gene_type:complete